MASRPGAAPGKLSFGDSAARAGARLVEIKRAGSCVGLWPSARTSRPVPLAEPTLGESPAFQQRTNTSWRSTRSQPAVSRRLFRCLGAHLLRSPLIVKSSADTLACFLATAGQNPSVENLGSPTPQTVWCLLASSRCRFAQCHSATPFVIGFNFASHSWAIKNPASDLVSRVGKSRMSFRVTCLP